MGICVALVALLAVGCGQVVTGSATAAEYGTTTSSTPPPAALPASIGEAAVAPGTAELMERIRAAQVCYLHNRDFATRHGTPAQGWLITGYTGCGILVNSDVEPGASYVFELSLAQHYFGNDRAQDLAEEVGGHQIFRSRTTYGTFDCTYYLPIGKTGFAHSVRGRRAHSPGQPTEWPTRCEDTKAYLGALATTLIEMPPHIPANAPSREDLFSKDPCETASVLGGLFSGWTPGKVGWISPYSCSISLTKPGDPYQITVESSFRYNAEPKPGPGERVIQHAGAVGIEATITSDQALSAPNSCGHVLVTAPAEPAGSTTAQLASTTVSALPIKSSLGAWPALPIDVCDRARAVADTVMAALG